MCFLIELAALVPFATAPSGAADGPAPLDSPAARFEITFELHRGDLLVHLDLAGDEDGETALACASDWAGVEPGGIDLSGLEARGSRSGALEVERRADHLWNVRHAPGERLAVTYTIAANEHQGSDDPSVHYRPIVNVNLVHLLGNLALLVPEDRDHDELLEVQLGWEAFDEEGWDAACSFASGLGPHRFQATWNQLQQAVYLAGALRVVRRDVRGQPVHVAIAGQDWGFEDTAFAELVTAIVALEREFFDDFASPYYLVTLLGVGERNLNRESMGGTGLTNSFALFLQPGAQIEPDSGERGRITQLLAHEMFHEWNGRVIGRAEEALNYWFSEGFTDFYARRLLFRGGLIDTEAYAHSLNEVLAEYWSSPERDTPNTRIGEAFWDSRDLKRLPYLRGDLVAVQLDHAIRTRSEGQRSLDDFMRALASDRTTVSNELLLERIEALVAPEDFASLRRVILEGGPVDISPGALGPCLRVETTSETGFELGFDRDASMRDKVVAGVVEGSAAHRAGLRDGQTLAGRVSINLGRKDVPVVLDVRDGDGNLLALTWKPEGAALFRPMFIAVDQQGCDGL